MSHKRWSFNTRQCVCDRVARLSALPCGSRQSNEKGSSRNERYLLWASFVKATWPTPGVTGLGGDSTTVV